jgi:O-antigen ligase
MGQTRMHGSNPPWQLSKLHLWLCIVAAIGSVLVGLGLALVSPYIVLMLVLAIAAALAFLARPQAAIAILLLVRPSLDVFRGFYLPTPFGDVLNPAGIVTIALVAGLVVWIVDHRIRVLAYPVSRPYVAFLLACALSVSVSPIIPAALGEWLRFLSYLLLYVFVRETTRNPHDIARLTAVVILSSIVPITVGLYQIVTGQVSVFYGIPQVRSVFVHQNGYGIFLVLVGTTALLAFISESQRRLRYGYGLLLFLILFSLIRTYARVAWVGFIVSVAVIGAAEYHKWLVMLPPALMALWWWVPNVRARIMLAFTDALAFAGSEVENNSLVSRVLRWQEAIRLFRSSPLWGTGLRSYNSDSYLSGRYTAFSGVQVHSTYFQFLAETGILGLGSFLWLQVALVKEVWQGIRIVHDPRLRPTVLAFAGMLAANLVMGLTDNLISSPVIQWYLWTFAGLAGCAIELQARQEISGYVRSCD